MIVDDLSFRYTQDLLRHLEKKRKKKCDNKRVYFMRQGDSNYYKIGYTTNLKQRLKSIQMYSPITITVTASTKANCKFEKYLHRKYNEYNVRGEWFELPPNILKKAIKFSTHKATFRNQYNK
tara:strand:+ start:413 stop:778 length:366 start_codon:yes stop_codon:yes gene_type:complete